MELVMSFEENDKELIAALQKQFGDQVKYECSGKGFDGLEILLTAIVPITALTVQIIDFIIENFCRKDEESNSNSRKRVIVEPDGSIDLSGYSGEEACKIIESYFERQNDKGE